ncbi:DNA repair protein RecN [bacterium]|nr:DNA repair protein RecN [bacterium]
MLKELKIKNLILVKETTVMFDKGLNVITGETGAGKSVIIGSLNLLLGERTHNSIIRKGEKSSSVCAVVDISAVSSIKGFLAEQGIRVDNNELIIERILTVNSNNRQYINGTAVSLNLLKSIGKIFLDIHGQHDHQSLFNIDTHKNFLDWFAGQLPALEKFKTEFELYQSCIKELGNLKETKRNSENDQKLWKYELAEIEKAQLNAGEEKSLNEQYSKIANAKEIKEKCFQINDILYDSDQSVHCTIGSIARILQELSSYDNFFLTQTEICEQINTLIEEVSQETRRHGDESEYNPCLLQELEDRIDVLENIKRKFNKNIPDIINYADKLKSRLLNEESLDDKINLLEKKIEKIHNNLLDNADIISKKRRSYAPKLCDKIENEFKRLGMNDAKIQVLIEKQSDLTDTGGDRVEFLFAPNVGELWSPLRRTASGGEISRIMLALKSTFADADNIPVMVFDEIDVNIGGETARQVGHRLSELAKSHQILCITHLPQIAGFAQTHFKVEKQVVGDRTLTKISKLNRNDRIDEIARMLGGTNLTSVTRRHAKELIDNITE